MSPNPSSLRPDAVTWLAYLQFLSVVIALLGATLGRYEWSVTVVLQILLALVTGIGWMAGANWTRLLFIFVWPIPLLLVALVEPGSKPFIIGTVKYVIFLIVLMQPEAKAFFGSKEGARRVE